MSTSVLHEIARRIPNLTPDDIEVQARARDNIETLCREFMPSGSGFDAGTTLDMDASRVDRLVFLTSFHHMDDVGCYDGWTEHRVTVSATFLGEDIRVSGRDKHGIKEYIADTFAAMLAQTIEVNFDRGTKTFEFRLVSQ